MHPDPIMYIPIYILDNRYEVLYYKTEQHMSNV
jgi:hypothetical protein